MPPLRPHLLWCQPKRVYLLEGAEHTDSILEEKNDKDCVHVLVDAPVECPKDSLLTGLECCGRFCGAKELKCQVQTL